MQPLETIQIEERIVGCDGGGGPLGHPLVYLHLGPDGKTECPYCGRLYVLRGAAKQASGH